MIKLNKILCANKDLSVKLIKAVGGNVKSQQTIQQSYEMLLEIQTLNLIHQEYLEKRNELKEEIDEMDMREEYV